jgi:putative peptide modification system cyclase
LMQRKPGTALDRAIASEIALRDGARAVILPTVSEVGGRVRVSAEVIDPQTQTTVYAESADGTGAESTLESIDTVTAALRGKLGEALESVEKTSAPLPQVSTGNLDALRAYALGQKAYSENRYTEALPLFERATALDGQFALAWLGQARAQYAYGQASAAIPALRKAQALRSRLPARDAMYLDGWAAEFDKPAEALERWQLMAKLYPDYMSAFVNVAIRLIATNRFAEALPYATHAASSPQYELAGFAFDQVGRARLGMENYSAASSAFNQAIGHGYRNSSRRLVDVVAAQRKFGRAQSLIEKGAKDDPDLYLERVSLAVDKGAWLDARESARVAMHLTEQEHAQYWRSFLLVAAVTDWLAGDSKQAVQRANDAAGHALAALKNETNAEASDDLALALSAALFVQRLGDHDLSKRILAMTDNYPTLMALPELAELADIVRAEQARLSGHAEEALARLKVLSTGHERYQTQVALLEAYAAVGQTDAALQMARELKRKRGLAYVELGCLQCLQVLNIADSNLATLRAAELMIASKRPVEARQMLADFDRSWAAEDLPPYLRVRRATVIEASSAGGF